MGALLCGHGRYQCMRDIDLPPLFFFPLKMFGTKNLLRNVLKTCQNHYFATSPVVSLWCFWFSQEGFPFILVELCSYGLRIQLSNI